MPSTHSYESSHSRKSSGLGWAKRLAVIAAIIGIGVYSMLFFGGITVRVTPRIATITLDRNYMARQNPGADLPDVGRFEIMKVSKNAMRVVPATGEQKVSQKASGRITIFNSGSETPQRLIANTRFESKEGKVYRITKGVTIPGKTANGPGSIETTVYADKAGNDYNSGLTEFTIPGLKGSPRFETTWAVSKTEISGGFEGVRKMASAEAIKEAEAAIKAETTIALEGELVKQVPDGFILYGDASVSGFVIREGDVAPDDGDTYTVEGTATAYGILFNRAELSKLVATRELSDYDGNPVLIENMDELEFTLLNKENFIPEQTEQIVFQFRGPARIVWQFDEEKLRQDLAGLSKRQYETVFIGYPAIQRAESDFNPSWRRSFPDDPDKIVIELVAQ